MSTQLRPIVSQIVIVLALSVVVVAQLFESCVVIELLLFGSCVVVVLLLIGKPLMSFWEPGSVQFNRSAKT